MNSPIYNDWVEEERREAAEQATKQANERATKDNIIYLVESKFEIMPGDIRRKIENIGNTSILKGLLKKLLTVSSIEEFSEFLNEIKSKA